MASVRGAFSASTRLWASVVTSIPEPLPNLFITLALAAAPEVVVLDVVPVVLVVVEPDVLLELLEVAVELAVEGVEEDTDVTMALTYWVCNRQLMVKLEH
jgi:hypothetical protein